MRELRNVTKKMITNDDEVEQLSSKTTEKKMKTDITLPSLKDFMEKVERKNHLNGKNWVKRSITSKNREIRPSFPAKGEIKL